MENDPVHVHQGGGKAQDLVKRGIGRSAELALERSKIYRLFSHLFSYPEGELFGFIKDGDLLREMGRAVQRLRENTPDQNSGQGILDSLSLVTRWIVCSVLESLQDEYSRLFESHREKSLLYEAQYLDFPLEEMADIAGFYRAFGFTFEGRPDHLGAELEFLHLLTAMEAGAALEGNEGHRELCRDGQRKFLAAHLGRWVGGFLKGMRDRQGFYYYHFTSALADWLKMESRHLGITIERAKEARKREPEIGVYPALNGEGRVFGEL